MKAVIFDFDGVLVDSVPIYRRAVEDLMERMGVAEPVTDEIVSSDTRTVAQRLIEYHRLAVDVETLAGTIERYALDKLLAGPSIVPGARELVEALTAGGIALAIASLAPRRNILTVLKPEGLDKYFNIITSIEDVQKIKPNPEIFLTAAEGLGVDPRDCVVVEDSDRGVAAARAAGMAAVALTTTLPAGQLQDAHLIVADISELTPEILSGVFRDAAGKS